MFVLFNDSDREAGKVELALREQPRKLRCLPANEGAAVFDARCHNTANDLFRETGVHHARGDVVEEEERLCPAHDNVVDAGIDDISPQVLELAHGERDLELGADVVRA